MSSKLGRLQIKVLDFAKRNPNEWLSYAPDFKRVVESLAKRGLIKINEYNQFMYEVKNVHTN